MLNDWSDFHAAVRRELQPLADALANPMIKAGPMTTNTPIDRAAEAVREKIEARRADLKTLEPGWDGYGAHPIPHDVIDAFVDDVLTFTGDKWAQIVPGGDGSLQAEWHLRDRSVHLCREPDGSLYLYMQEATAPLMYEAARECLSAAEAQR